MLTRSEITKITVNRLVFFEKLLDDYLPETVMITARSFDDPLYENISFEFEFLSPRHKKEDFNVLTEVVGFLGGVTVTDGDKVIAYFKEGGYYGKD